MDEKKKEATRRRYLRAEKKFLDYEEQKERKQSARIRKSEEQARPPRQRDWADEEDYGESSPLEKMAPTRPLRSGSRSTQDPVLENLSEALVTGLACGRAELMTEDEQFSARLSGSIVTQQQSSIAVGDRVLFDSVGGQARVQRVLERRSSLSRPDPSHPGRERVLAANVDLAVIVNAVREPGIRPGLIDRFLIALERSGVKALICINKIDLIDDETAASTLDEELLPYQQMDVDISSCSVLSGYGIAELTARLSGKSCVFVGHSGVGKSSLLNAIDPDAARRIASGRKFDGKGRHTTTSSSLRTLPGGGSIIDTPGLRSFGLWDIDAEDLWQHFPDLIPHAKQCRFSDCRHQSEPDCGVREAAVSGSLSEARYASYLRILQSL
ncbi:MAG: ribosome small subunit-dependent GTPase A [Planctomycetota bacterium]|jgi:ribosome biogenesis GTPase